MKAHIIEGKSDDKKPLKKKWLKTKSKEGTKPFKKDKVKFTCYKKSWLYSPQLSS